MSPLMKEPGRARRFLNVVLAACVTAIVTLLMAYGLSSISHQSDLASRVDRNAAIARSNVVIARAGVDSIVCILAIQPEDRTNARIQDCMRTHGYLTYFTAGGP